MFQIKNIGTIIKNYTLLIMIVPSNIKIVIMV